MSIHKWLLIHHCVDMSAQQEDLGCRNTRPAELKRLHYFNKMKLNRYSYIADAIPPPLASRLRQLPIDTHSPKNVRSPPPRTRNPDNQ